MRTPLRTAALLIALQTSTAQAAPITIAIADFDYTDTSGEVRDQRAAHAARLQNLTTAIIAVLARSGRFAPEPLHCPKPPCSAGNMDQDEMVKAARAQHAELVVFGGVHKSSTLVQWGQVEVMKTATGQPSLLRAVTFRGDSDDAWNHAADYIGQMLVGGIP